MLDTVANGPFFHFHEAQTLITTLSVGAKQQGAFWIFQAESVTL